VRQDRPVVVMDGGPSVAAARCWWLLRHHGHDDARVLDGGLAAWLAAGGPVTTETAPAAPGDIVAGAGRLPVVDAATAGALARSGVLLDARAPARYRGEVEPVDPVAGHIPGARNLPTASVTAPDGRLLPADRLRAVLADAGVTVGVPVGASCGSGVTAAHTLLALEVAGIPAALYPGSFSEWLRDPARSVATGPEPG
jgi:thiosulfate/3-mercaptopyruvate sulfurtransferase